MKIISSIAFLCFLVLPLIQMFVQIPLSEGVKLRERRALKPFPVLSELSVYKWPSAIEEYFQDHYGLRDLFIMSANSFRYHLLGVSPVSKVTVGKNGWLYYGGLSNQEFTQGKSRFSSVELEHIKRVYESRKEFLDSLGIKYLIIVPPSKGTIYPEYYDPFLPAHSEYNRFDQFLSEVAMPLDLPVLYLKEALIQAKESVEKPVYIPTDSHWNDLGAYAAYLRIVERLLSYGVDIEAVPLDEYRLEVRKRLIGFARMLGVFRPPMSEIPVYVRRGGDTDLNRAREKRSKMTTHTSGRVRPLYVEREYLQKYVAFERVFVYRDSFFNRLMKFLSLHFKEGYYFSNTHYDFDYSTIWRKRPELVIEQFTDQALGLPAFEKSDLRRHVQLRYEYQKKVVENDEIEVHWREHRISAQQESIQHEGRDRHRPNSVLKANISLENIETDAIARVRLVSAQDGQLQLRAKLDRGGEIKRSFPVAPTTNQFYFRLPSDATSAKLQLEVVGTDEYAIDPLRIVSNP